eukprot:TRINITY_DN10047_c0_g1_i1.p1 TRINITY_DN10047_c0_g1~~TRINITY_DN10047_c0_g1_i1.p1  ORF type:complete len:527 (+),score=76.20 TRINITY_DN10047_c0_g1_i1:37-1617(+)
MVHNAFALCACLCCLPASCVDFGDYLHFGRNGPADILAELERPDLLRQPEQDGRLKARAASLEKVLRPLLASDPKDFLGRVDADAARLALHRLFLKRHGWFVHGVASRGAVRNGSRAVEALRTAERYSVSQLARFAAALEALVRDENERRLQQAFDIHGLDRSTPKSVEQARLVVKTYMVLFVTSYQDPANLLDYSEAKRDIEKHYSSWQGAQVLIEGIRADIFQDEEDEGVSTTLWESSWKVVAEIGEFYGRWQNRECLEMKDALLELDTEDRGRIFLSSFWKPLLRDPDWMFDESLPYLQQLGILDGRDAPEQSVFIPNYLHSPVNCLTGSKYYSFCCFNECESLQSKIEDHVGTLEADPRMVAKFVARLPSDTVRAPRTLPAALLQLLEEIARAHGGTVPLRGRRFALFLHRAFKNECPYPHPEDHDAIKNPSRWIDAVENATIVQKNEVLEYVRAAAARSNKTENASVETLPTEFLLSFDDAGIGPGVAGFRLSRALWIPFFCGLITLMIIVYTERRKNISV